MLAAVAPSAFVVSPGAQIWQSMELPPALKDPIGQRWAVTLSVLLVLVSDRP
jgi:hypothetical protein